MKYVKQEEKRDGKVGIPQEGHKMEELNGYVEHIVFQNSENGYTVLNLETEDEEIV